MGTSRTFICQNGHEQTYYLGVGMGYPSVYEEVVTAIRNGDFGDEIKRYFKENKGAVVDASRCLYVCDSCHHAHEAVNLDLYLKKSADEEVDYWCSWCDDEDAEFIKHYPHTCPDCGASMTLAIDDRDDSEVPNDLEIACPECGTPAHLKPDAPVIMWD